METNNSSDNKQSLTLEKMKFAVIILMVAIAVVSLLNAILMISNKVSNYFDRLYNPRDGAVTVINSPDGSAQIIVREGTSGFSTETRFYYKKVGSSKEYKIGKVGIGNGNYESPFFWGCEHEITWSAADVTIKILTIPEMDYWQTLTFTFPS